MTMIVAPAGISISVPSGGGSTGQHLTALSNFCTRCGFGGCDARVVECGCAMHARCLPVSSDAPMSTCPQCHRTASGLELYPMTFHEIDRSRHASSSGKRRRKRKEVGGFPGNDGTSATPFDQVDGFDCRTGRWTTEETTFCDKLIDNFQAGTLPIVDGVKLNDFLANMLRSKQSRLTKKMKNANLSAKSFKRTTGYIADLNRCRGFSEVEAAFFHSIPDQQERAEIRFHMQKEWRELFSNFCVSVGQPLDAKAWLSSVEEMDRRLSAAKDAARMARRKMMLGYAFSQDCQNPDHGVFIENADLATTQAESPDSGSQRNAVLSGGNTDTFFSLLDEHSGFNNDSSVGATGKHKTGKRRLAQRGWNQSSPFLGRVMSYVQRHMIPFEHVDAWVPSFVPSNDDACEGSGSSNTKTSCRLCYAGCATAEVQIPSDGNGAAHVLLTQEEQFNLSSFGDYSQKFSFNVGCGLPGRVYHSGIPTWEQSVHNAPYHHFERCGGAIQCGIKTVVGIPVPSPNVGRIVVTLYSRHDRNKDQDLIIKLCDEFSKLMPSPKWKLVVDIGRPAVIDSPLNQSSTVLANTNNETAVTTNMFSNDSNKKVLFDDIVSLLGEHMPSDLSSPYAPYLPGFMSLRLMLLKPTRTPLEEDIGNMLLNSYISYTASGRAKSDVAVMLARDFMFLK